MAASLVAAIAKDSHANFAIYVIRFVFNNICILILSLDFNKEIQYKINQNFDNPINLLNEYDLITVFRQHPVSGRSPAAPGGPRRPPAAPGWPPGGPRETETGC